MKEKIHPEKIGAEEWEEWDSKEGDKGDKDKIETVRNGESDYLIMHILFNHIFYLT